MTWSAEKSSLHHVTIESSSSEDTRIVSGLRGADEWLRLSRRVNETAALFLTDLHIGSRWGLWNPHYQLKEESEANIDFQMNSVQSKLWDYWRDLCRRLDRVRPDLIFLLGHIINGSNPHDHGDRSFTSNLDDQSSCALSILRMIPKKAHTRIIGLVDSGYRDREYLKAHEQLCDKLGGLCQGTTGIFKFGDHDFRMYHGSTTAYVYLETVMGRRRTFAQEAVAGKKLPEIDGIICGRSHRWLHMRTMWRAGKDFHVVLCPGWEGQTDFMAMKDPDKMIPEIGAVLGRFKQGFVDFQCVRYPTPWGISTSVKI